jgi:hypothetical protein
MKTTDKIFNVSLAILIAIGMQYFIVGAMTLRMMDFSSFNIYNWIMEIVYLSCAITFSLKDNL